MAWLGLWSSNHSRIHMPHKEVSFTDCWLCALLKGFAVTRWGVCYLILRLEALLLSSHICFEIMLGFIKIQSYFQMKKWVWFFSSLCVACRNELFICNFNLWRLLQCLCSLLLWCARDSVWCRSVSQVTMTSLNDIIVYCSMVGCRVDCLGDVWFCSFINHC